MVYEGITVKIEKIEGKTTKALASYSRVAYGEGVVDVTNAAGEFSFENVPEGSYKVYAASECVKKAQVSEIINVKEGQTEIVEITLVATGSIKGKVLVDGKGKPGLVAGVIGTSYIAVTDADGAFEISGVPAGSKYKVYASVLNGEGYSAEIDVTADNVSDAGNIEIVFPEEKDDKLSNVSAIALDEGILFFVGAELPPDVPLAGTSLRLTLGNLVYISYERNNNIYGYKVLFPFVESGKTYDFVVEILENEYVYYRENVSIQAEGGLGELKVTNLYDLTISVTENTADKMVVSFSEYPEFNCSLPCNLSMTYILSKKETLDAKLASWIYNPVRKQGDERALKFDLFDEETYREYDWGGWRNVNEVKASLLGNYLVVNPIFNLEVYGYLGTFQYYPGSDLRLCVKNNGEQVKVKVYNNYPDLYDVWFSLIPEEEQSGAEAEEEIEFIKDHLLGQVSTNFRSSFGAGNFYLPKGVNVKFKTPNQELPFGHVIYTYPETPELSAADDASAAAKQFAKTAKLASWQFGYTYIEDGVLKNDTYYPLTSKDDFYKSMQLEAGIVLDQMNDKEPVLNYYWYPLFDYKYTVSFEANGGKVLENGKEIESTEFNLYLGNNLPTPEKEGFTFDGWYEDKDFTKPFSAIDVDNACDKTVYAKWISE